MTRHNQVPNNYLIWTIPTAWTRNDLKWIQDWTSKRKSNAGVKEGSLSQPQRKKQILSKTRRGLGITPIEIISTGGAIPMPWTRNDQMDPRLFNDEMRETQLGIVIYSKQQSFYAKSSGVDHLDALG